MRQQVEKKKSHWVLWSFLGVCALLLGYAVTQGSKPGDTQLVSCAGGFYATDCGTGEGSAPKEGPINPPQETSTSLKNPGGQITRNVPQAGGTVTVKGEQMKFATIIIDVGRQKKLPRKAWIIAIMTALTEAKLHNPDNATDHDSLGLFQQRPSQGWCTPKQCVDPRYSSTKFYNALVKLRGGWQTLSNGVAAQRVQRSAYAERYAWYQDLATDVVDHILAGNGLDKNGKPV